MGWTSLINHCCSKLRFCGTLGEPVNTHTLRLCTILMCFADILQSLYQSLMSALALHHVTGKRPSHQWAFGCRFGTSLSGGMRNCCTSTVVPDYGVMSPIGTTSDATTVCLLYRLLSVGGLSESICAAHPINVATTMAEYFGWARVLY